MIRKLYQEAAYHAWIAADRGVRWAVWLSGILFLVAALSLATGCSTPSTLQESLAALVADGTLTPEQAQQLSEAGVPQWATIAGSIIGAAGTAFLGVRVAKNGMATALSRATELAQQAHARLDEKEAA